MSIFQAAINRKRDEPQKVLPQEEPKPSIFSRAKELNTQQGTLDLPKKQSVNPAKDSLKQFGKQALIGLGGTYGDLAELAGINTSEESIRKQSEADFSTLERINEPGYKPNVADFESLSEDQIVPRNFRLPTSENLEEVNTSLGGPGDPETPAGRYGSRIGRIFGSGVSLGTLNPIPAIVAGGAGQTAEEIGIGPLGQAGAEIAALLLTGSVNINKQSPEIKKKIADLRNLGYSDQDITLAVNSANKGGKLAKKASKSSNTEQAFKDVTERSNELVNDIVSSEIPGIERGSKYVHELASDAYGEAVKDAINIKIKNSKPFVDSANKVMKELTNTLGKNPEAQPFIKRLEEAIVDTKKNPTAETYVNFYKELNGMSKWMGRSQRNNLITEVKNGIKDSFKSEGKQGAEFSNRFEKANQGIQKAYLAEDLSNILQNSKTEGAFDFKKLNKALEKQDNRDLFKKVLGDEQAKNLELITKISKDIKDFDKSYKAVKGLKILDVGSKGFAAYYLLKGDLPHLVMALGFKVPGMATRKLNELFLTDPRFQKFTIQMLDGLKKNSPTAFKRGEEGIKRYLEEQGISVENYK